MLRSVIVGQANHRLWPHIESKCLWNENFASTAPLVPTRHQPTTQTNS